MVNFWDTSAIVPLLVLEADTKVREAQLKEVSGVVTWWATRIECVSAICRRKREGLLSAAAADAAFRRLDSLADQWMVVSPSEIILLRAERLLKVHPLRAADALQLAAALLATREETHDSCFFTADKALSTAADKEGFSVH
jgi:predicted nucleic acid-binding protein